MFFDYRKSVAPGLFLVEIGTSSILIPSGLDLVENIGIPGHDGRSIFRIVGKPAGMYFNLEISGIERIRVGREVLKGLREEYARC